MNHQSCDCNQDPCCCGEGGGGTPDKLVPVNPVQVVREPEPEGGCFIDERHLACLPFAPGIARCTKRRLETQLCDSQISLLGTQGTAVQEQPAVTGTPFGLRFVFGVALEGCYGFNWLEMVDAGGTPITSGNYVFELAAGRIAEDADGPNVDVFDEPARTGFAPLAGTPGRCPCAKLRVCGAPIGPADASGFVQPGVIALTVWTDNPANLPATLSAELYWKYRPCKCIIDKICGREQWTRTDYQLLQLAVLNRNIVLGP